MTNNKRERKYFHEDGLALLFRSGLIIMFAIVMMDIDFVDKYLKPENAKAFKMAAAITSLSFITMVIKFSIFRFYA